MYRQQTLRICTDYKIKWKFICAKQCKLNKQNIQSNEWHFFSLPHTLDEPPARALIEHNQPKPGPWSSLSTLPQLFYHYHCRRWPHRMCMCCKPPSPLSSFRTYTWMQQNDGMLKVRQGPQRKPAGFQAQLICLTPWTTGSHPGQITSLCINSSYGL